MVDRNQKVAAMISSQTTDEAINSEAFWMS
jgi:hypothetical protein